MLQSAIQNYLIKNISSLKLIRLKRTGFLVTTVIWMENQQNKLRFLWERSQPRKNATYPSKKIMKFSSSLQSQSQLNFSQPLNGLGAIPSRKSEINPIADHAGLLVPLRQWVTESVSPVVKTFKPESPLKTCWLAAGPHAVTVAKVDIYQVPGTILRILELLLDVFTATKLTVNLTSSPRAIKQIAEPQYAVPIKKLQNAKNHA